LSTGVDLGAVLRPVRQGNAFEETVEAPASPSIKLGMIARGDRFPRPSASSPPGSGSAG